MLAKAAAARADMIICDLEDAVAPSEKEAARATICDALWTHDWGDKTVFARVNAWDSRHTVHDVLHLVTHAGPRLDGLMLPKVQSAAEVVALDLVMRQAELADERTAGELGIEIQIETARGLQNVDAICAASPRLEAVILGPADFSASMGMPVLTGGVQIPDYPGDHFHFAYSRLLIAGRAAGIQVIDGPYLNIRDLDGLRDYCQRARWLGLDGKWAIHPDQVATLNEIFSPTEEQVERAQALLAAYADATEGDGRGAVRFGSDEMIDEASAKMAHKIMELARRCGTA